MGRIFKSRKACAARELVALSLGEIQKPTSRDWRKHYQCTPAKRHEHAWLLGTVNAVCTVCGKTVAKETILRDASSPNAC
jgi:hypothetical protein